MRYAQHTMRAISYSYLFIYLFISVVLLTMIIHKIHIMNLPTEDCPKKYKYLFPLGLNNWFPLVGLIITGGWTDG